MALLEVRNLTVEFPARAIPGAHKVRQKVRAVNQVSFDLGAGETLGLVGESGCGKSTLARAIARLVEPAAGSIRFDGQEIAKLRGKALRQHRRKLQMIFQDPIGSLDPRLAIEDLIGEGIDIHGLAENRSARRARVRELLQAVGLDPAHADRYPHEFSGGQRQRIGIARALAVDPKLIICDEAVSALDVSVQAQIVNLLRDLQQKRGLAYLFIAHDLAVVAHLSRRILVMYLGAVVESAEAKSLIANPQHPYTRALLSSVPTLDTTNGRRRILLPGDVPSSVSPPSGCPFHPRCPVAQFPRCQAEAPAFREVAPGHWAACHFPGAGAPLPPN